MNRRRDILILTPGLVPYDAIGNDVTQMRLALLERGHRVRVYAEGIHPSCASIAAPLNLASSELWRSSDDILIYHHSIGWPQGEEVLFGARSRIVVRYHNITPARFFAPYSAAHTRACELGAEANKRVAKLPNMFVVGDSAYNCEDLVALGANPDYCRVLPPFHLTEELGREQFDVETLSRNSGATTNILFVGGVKPNKGHARAIRVFAEYERNFNDRSRLIFAGGFDERLAGYVDEITILATMCGVGEKVVFTGAMTGAQLKSLYVSADVFLCTSEHEGFCVPLVESMYFRVPIVAWGVTAVQETVGERCMMLEDWNEVAFAARIDKIVEDHQTAEHLGSLGRRRYQEAFAPKVLRAKLSEIIAEVSQ